MSEVKEVRMKVEVKTISKYIVKSSNGFTKVWADSDEAAILAAMELSPDEKDFEIVPRDEYSREYQQYYTTVKDKEE